jgi:Protein of unknown function (DUF1573)
VSHLLKRLSLAVLRCLHGLYKLIPSLLLLVLALLYYLYRPDHWEPVPDAGNRFQSLAPGAKCFYIAASRLGCCLDLDSALMRISFWESGVALDSLRDLAPFVSLRIEGKSIGCEEALKQKCPVIIHLTDNTFICGDPREVKRGESEASRNSLRVFKSDTPAGWLTIAELRNLWRGRVLTVDRILPRVDVLGPRIVFDSCWEDINYHRNAENAKVSFRYRNEGTLAGVIKLSDKSSGCVCAELSHDMLNPGQSGTLTVRVTLANKPTYWRERVLLSTGNIVGHVAITVCGGVTDNECPDS